MRRTRGISSRAHAGEDANDGAERLMPARRISVDPAAALRDGFATIRAAAQVEVGFAADAEAEARAAAAETAGAGASGAARDRVDLPFVTIDPPGSRDLDQALHIERRGDGHRVRYAIADLGAFVVRDRALDREVHRRAVTVYAPDENAPLHPLVLSEGAASLLPGEWRPAVLWTLDLDATGALVATTVVRAEVRSVAQHTYADVPADVSALLQEVGERRLALERARGGVRLAVPDQEVVEEGGTWTVRYRVPLPTEDWNAQISLLTGMAAAALMLRAGTGILRTQAPPNDRALARLRHQADALGVPWPADLSYPEFVRGLDPSDPAQAAAMHEATAVGGAAGYTAFDGEPPAEAGHFAVAAEYAHATAPLRRLQDRYVAECCLAACAGTPVPDWVRAALPDLPKAMIAGARRAGTVERGVVDLVEATILAGREGERFSAVVIDDGLVQLRDPAVVGRLADGGPPPGHEVSVRLERADPATRTVLFAAA
jgi:exoribonuclease R